MKRAAKTPGAQVCLLIAALATAACSGADDNSGDTRIRDCSQTGEMITNLAWFVRP